MINVCFYGEYTGSLYIANDHRHVFESSLSLINRSSDAKTQTTNHQGSEQ